MLDDQRLWIRLCRIVLEGFSMMGCPILTPFEARSEWKVQELGSVRCAGRGYGDGEEEERRLLPAHSTVDGSECHARMGSDEAFNGCYSGANVHTCSYRSLSARYQCWK